MNAQACLPVDTSTIGHRVAGITVLFSLSNLWHRIPTQLTADERGDACPVMTNTAKPEFGMTPGVRE